MTRDPIRIDMPRCYGKLYDKDSIECWTCSVITQCAIKMKEARDI